MIETIGAISTVLAVIGVFYNNRLDIRCFYFWWGSNLICTVIHLHAGLWSLAVRDVIFFGMAVHGCRCWHKKQRGDDE